eukprot:5412557-Pyramimonas_sp.AAC.1
MQRAIEILGDRNKETGCYRPHSDDSAKSNITIGFRKLVLFRFTLCFGVCCGSLVSALATGSGGRARPKSQEGGERMLGATVWMLGATVWMLGATVWMLGATVGVLRGMRKRWRRRFLRR